jgi:putative oxidoreductase
MRPFIKLLPATLLIMLFVYAAASKLLIFDAFGSQLHKQPFPSVFADVLQYVIPLSEILAVALLLSSRYLYAGLLLSFSLLLVFTGYIVLVLIHFWSSIPCPCGGILSHLSWSAHLVFNSFFIGLTLIGISIHFKERRETA